MYLIQINSSNYTIPKENIRLFAMTQAIDLKKPRKFSTDKEAINFLQTIGMKIYEKIHN